jgi:hypothetical protein
MRQAAESRQNQGKTPMPPTTSRYMLEEWSACFGWQERLRREQAEAEAARRGEMIRQTEAQVRQNAALMQQVGAGALALAAAMLNRIVDPKTGALRQHVAVRDLSQLMRVGAELVLLSTAQPTSILVTGDQTALETVLREADEGTKQRVLEGLRAALAWHERRKHTGAP